MTTTSIVQQSPMDASVIEAVVMGGDLARLTPDQRVAYYYRVCESLGLNPLTKPFSYIVLNDKLTLYANRDCTDQLRKRDSITVSIVGKEVIEGVYIVTAEARTPEGRVDSATGAVPLVKEGGDWKTNQAGKRFFAADGTYAPLRPEDRANAVMKAETKAKRRVTLSICGLGWLDESETGSIEDARIADVDTTTGEIIGGPVSAPDGEWRKSPPEPAPPPQTAEARPGMSLEEALERIHQASTLGALDDAVTALRGYRWSRADGQSIAGALEDRRQALVSEGAQEGLPL